MNTLSKYLINGLYLNTKRGKTSQLIAKQPKTSEQQIQPTQANLILMAFNFRSDLIRFGCFSNNLVRFERFPLNLARFGGFARVL